MTLPIGGWPLGQPLPENPPEVDVVLHFSEDPTIERFVPRPVAANPNSEPVVWAIDEKHAPLYFFPRDCPRVAFWALPNSTPEDMTRFLGTTTAQMVIAMESAWLERLRACELYAYRFDAAPFVALKDSVPGGHATTATVVPIAVEPVGDLLTRLCEANVELRITPSLWPLREALLPATMHYSMTRMRNAAPPPKDTDTKTP